MEATKVGIREFRAGMAEFISSSTPVAALMARSNSPTRGHPKFPQAAQSDYDCSTLMAMRAAASLSL